MGETEAAVDIVTSIGNNITSYTSWMGTALNFVTSNSLALLLVTPVVIGGAIGLVKRLIRV